MEMGPAAQSSQHGGVKQSGYVVNTGKEVILTTALSDQLLRKAVASAKEGKGLGGDAG